MVSALRDIEDAQDRVRAYELGRNCFIGLALLGLAMFLSGIMLGVIGVLDTGAGCALAIPGFFVTGGGIGSFFGWRWVKWHSEFPRDPYANLKEMRRRHEDLIMADSHD